MWRTGSLIQSVGKIKTYVSAFQWPNKLGYIIYAYYFYFLLIHLNMVEVKQCVITIIIIIIIIHCN